jgi:hypothetical protein
MTMSRIDLSPPYTSSRDLEVVKDALASNGIAPLGPHVDTFEREFAVAEGRGISGERGRLPRRLAFGSAPRSDRRGGGVAR